ncbi:MAG: phosphoribosyltransferase, partial [Sphingobacteriaceae bacterium]
PLSILLSKKIGHPANKEYAIGAVTLFGLHLNENAASVSKDYLESETEKIRSNLLSRQNLFLGNKPLPSLKDKIVIIIDDGIATGETIIAGIQQLRSQEPKKIIVAVPVSAKDTAYKIAQQTDEFICLYLPEDFKGVGEFYENFEQVSDDEVIAILKEH